jgi:hypothetical protein
LANEGHKKIFLSHAGEDRNFVLRLVAQIEEQWHREVPDSVAEVFCTSKNEYRFKELKQALGPEANWREETKRWEEELRQFLRQNLLGSAAYLLLVTEHSVKKNSAWIQFEIDIASERAGDKGGFFFPCLAEGATFSDLPEKARWWQAIDLASHDGMEKLIAALNMDFDWLAEHTHYGGRAREWDQSGRPANLLLSGNDILEAKTWAARRPKNAPEPTTLHLDFIRASEEEAEVRSSRAFLLGKALRRLMTMYQ